MVGGRGWLFPGLTLEVNVSGSGSWPQEPCTWTTGWFCGVDGSVDFSGVTKKQVSLVMQNTVCMLM